MTNKKLYEYLVDAGFLPKEAEVYLALLSSGTSSVSHIATKAKINRTTAYDLLEKLKSKGLVGEADNKKIRQFTALAPTSIESYISTQTQAWNQRASSLPDIISSMQAFQKTSPHLPVLTSFEGKQGIKEILQDQLRKDITNIDIISDLGSEIEAVIGSFMKGFAHAKTHKRIKTRLILPKQNTEFENKYYSPKAMQELFEIRYLGEAFSPDSEISIYGDTVSIFSLREEEPVAVLLESKVMADAHRALFEELWAKAVPRT